MKQQHRRLARRLAPAAAVLVAVGVTAGTMTTAGATALDRLSGSAAGAPSDAALKLVVPVATQTVERYSKESVDLYGLGFYAVAPKTVEIRTHRGTSYRDPITTTLSIGDGADKVTKTLPAGMTTNPGTLTSFFSVTVKDKAGKTVMRSKLDFCPNSYERARVTVDAPADSPYPQQCAWHPFSLGSVFGITGGWSTPVLGNYDTPGSFKGKDGTYTLTATMAKPWQQAFGLSAAESVSTIKLKVKTVKVSDRALASAVAAHTMTHNHNLSMTGMDMSQASLSPQHAAREAARQKALGVPNTPAKKAPAGKSISAAAADDLPKPDLRSLPATGIRLDRHKKTKKTYLTFGATVWNAGPSPLVVDGFRTPGKNTLDAYQYFFDANNNQVGHAPAGQLQWDGRTGHNHWHFKAFASYRLLDSTQKKAIVSGKEAFCLAPTDGVDLTVDGAQWQPQSTDLYTACGQGDKNLLSIREVLPTGWGDTYSQDLPGQSFDITNVKSGIYYVQTFANPEKKLSESNYDNNTSLRKVRIGGTPGGKRTLKVYDFQGVKG